MATIVQVYWNRSSYNWKAARLTGRGHDSHVNRNDVDMLTHSFNRMRETSSLWTTPSPMPWWLGMSNWAKVWHVREWRYGIVFTGKAGKIWMISFQIRPAYNVSKALATYKKILLAFARQQFCSFFQRPRLVAASCWAWIEPKVLVVQHLALIYFTYCPS